MREEVYEYLHDYGFSAIEIDEIEKRNENIYFTSVEEVNKNIKFLEEKYLEQEDIINTINNNPFMLTEKNNRLEELEAIYASLNIDYESMIKIIKSNAKTYTISPVELLKIINYLKDKNCTTEVIRNLIINNPKVIGMKFEDFEKAIRFN